MNLFCADIFSKNFLVCKKFTYEDSVFTTPSVRGQRTHSNAGTQRKLFKAKKAFPFDVYRNKNYFKIKQKTKTNKYKDNKKLVKNKKRKTNK